MADVTRLPFPLPPGVLPPLGIRAAVIEGNGPEQVGGAWYVEFHHPDYGRGTRWGPGAATHSPDFATEAEAVAVVRNLAEGWRCLISPTVIHPRGRTAADVAYKTIELQADRSAPRNLKD